MFTSTSLRFSFIGALLITSFSISPSQHSDSTHSLSPQYACCDDGAATGVLCTGYTAHYDPVRDCVESDVTGYYCVDHTRDHLLCQSWYTGIPYCRENPPNEYPRYYALYSPIGVSPSSLSFAAIQGGSNPDPQTIYVTNNVYTIVSGDYDLSWNTSENLSWLSLSPTSGHAYGTTPATTQVNVNISGMTEGTYVGSITFSSPMVSSRQNSNVTVTLIIASTLTITISGPSSLGVNQIGTWTATVSGGVSPYHYQWYYYPVCPDLPVQGGPKPLKPTCGYWYTNGADNKSWSHQDTYDFMVKCDVIDAKDSVRTSNVIYVTVPGTLARNAAIEERIQGESAISDASVFSFCDAYPNPFNPSTILAYHLAQSGHAKLDIFDLLGRQVIVLDEGMRDAGSYRFVWLGRNNAGNEVAGGVYVARLVVTDLKGKIAYKHLTKLFLIK